MVVAWLLTFFFLIMLFITTVIIIITNILYNYVYLFLADINEYENIYAHIIKLCSWPLFNLHIKNKYITYFYCLNYCIL